MASNQLADDREARALEVRGWNAFKRQDIERAEKWFHMAMEHDAGRPDAYVGFGAMALVEGRLQRAQLFLKQGLELARSGADFNQASPQLAVEGNRQEKYQLRVWLRAHFYYAMAAMRLRQWELAIEPLEAVARWPQTAVGKSARLLLGEAFHRLGQLEEAEYHYRQLPERTEALFNLALTRLALGHLDEAREFFERGRERNRFIPLLLAAKLERRPAHFEDQQEQSETSLAAADYVHHFIELWAQTPRAAQLLEPFLEHTSS